MRGLEQQETEYAQAHGQKDCNEKRYGVKDGVRRKVNSPVKPGIPLLLPLALALWAAAAFAYTQLEFANTKLTVVLAILSAACAIVVAAFLARTRHVHLIALLLGTILGICCASYGAFTMLAATAQAGQENDLWVFELTEDATDGTYGSKAAANAHADSGASAHVEIFFKDGVDLLCGDRIITQTKIGELPEKSRSYYWQRGISAVAYIDDFEETRAGSLTFLREARRQAIDVFAAYGGEQAGILQALACGYRNTIEQTGAYDNFKMLGLAHIVAVSGAHLSIVVMALEWLLRTLRVPRGLRIVVSSFFAAAYLIFAGIPISALRATFMVVLSLAASGARRRAASPNALALCIIVFIAINPSTAVSPSFFLSAGSTLGIILFTKLIATWMSGFPRLLRGAIAEPAGLTISSSIVTQPYSAALFSQLPLLSIPANILAAPLFSAACIAGLLCAALSYIIPGAAACFVTVAALVATPLQIVVTSLAKLPYICIPLDVPVIPMVVVSCAIGIALWFFWPHLSLHHLGGLGAITVLFLSAFMVFAPLMAGDEIIMLDVGQGDAFVIRSKGSSVLIDTGTQDSLLKRALGREMIYSLDGVVISHSDDDHYGSLPVLASLARVDNVYVAKDALSCGCDSCGKMLSTASEVVDDDGISGLSVGDKIKVGHFTLNVIWPVSYVDEGENADSICLDVSLDCNEDGIVDWESFFCGDAESEQLQQMVDAGSLGPVDVLKVGHHGSRAALTDELAEELHPYIALISVGADNRYGHPTEEALEHLEAVDAEILRTDEQGDVKLKFSMQAIDVS